MALVAPEESRKNSWALPFNNFLTPSSVPMRAKIILSMIAFQDIITVLHIKGSFKLHDESVSIHARLNRLSFEVIIKQKTCNKSYTFIRVPSIPFETYFKSKEAGQYWKHVSGN